eukprot:Skav234943  [mRNA]  locus=scaffold2817:19403:20146:- [translate_table: standard]
MEIAVIGGGLAGLSFAASILKESDVQRRVVVFERCPELDAGPLQHLQIKKPGEEALKRLGFLSDEHESHLPELERIELLRWLANQLPAGVLRFGKACTGLRSGEDQGIFCVVDGTDGTLELGPFDLLVAADGLRSSVRQSCAGLADLSRIFLLGDARRGFRRERDLGFSRIYEGGNQALLEGLRFADLLRCHGMEGLAVHGAAYSLTSNLSIGERINRCSKRCRSPALDPVKRVKKMKGGGLPTRLG